MISLNDFIPPLITRGSNKIKRLINKSPKHPFDCIPKDVEIKWFLDVGANVGQISKNALDSYPDCNVICFEPVSETFSTLKNTLKDYSDRCTLFNLALSTEASEAEINITSFHGANSLLPQSELHKQSTGVREVGKETIKLVKLDEISSTFPTSKIDVMKIDVEGFELNVLYGGKEFIKSGVDIIIVEVAPYRVTDLSYIADVFKFMDECGFSLINVYDVAPVTLHPHLLLGQMDCVFMRKSKI